MKTILTALDFSDITPSLLQISSALARTHGAALYLIHIEPPEPDFIGYDPGPQHVRNQVAEEAIRHFKEENQLRDQLRDEGIDAHSRVIQGPIVEKILEEAKRLSADLIVIGSHGHGALYHVLVGSVGEGILAHATCPVLVVPARMADNTQAE